MKFLRMRPDVLMAVIFSERMSAGITRAETEHTEERHRRRGTFRNVYCLTHGWIGLLQNAVPVLTPVEQQEKNAR